MNTKVNKKIRFIDLFSGIGGFHQAMKKVDKNSECVLVSEIEPHAIETYVTNYKYNLSIENIREIKNEVIPDHDFLFAGFPCQSFSSAGNKEGFLDKVRGTLFFEIARILEYKKPKYAILENVKHLIKHNYGETFNTILDVATKLGYKTTEQPLVLSPHHFGVPQNRERVFIVLVRSDIAKSKYLDFDFSNYKSTKINTKKYITQKPIDEKYFVKDKYLLNCFNAWEDFVLNIKRPTNRTMPVIWVDEFNKTYSLKGLSKWKIKYITDIRKLYKENKVYIDKWIKKYNVKNWKKREKKLEWQAGIDNFDFKNSFIQLRQSGIRCRKPIMFPTLVAMVQVPLIYVQDKGWRYLTPQENGNIQSFPKSFLPNRNDYQAYKQFGNSVNVVVVESIIREVLNKYE